MGLGLGLGLLVGVRAATANMTVVLLIVTLGLVLLAAGAPETMRPVLLCLVAGCVIGWAGAGIRMAEPATPVAVAPGTTITGIVASDLYSTARGTRATMIWEDNRGAHHEVVAFLPPGVDVGRGDRVLLHGRVVRESDTPMLFASSIVLVQRANRVEILRRSIREHIARNMVTNVPGSPGSLVSGLLIGDDSGLSNHERDDLRKSGLSHITAVSGWNVSVVIVTAGALFRALGARRLRWLIVQLVLLSVYVWIVGLEPPIQRAAIMGAIALVALQLGRPAHVLTLLMITAGVMATWNPDVLYSLSFMLSFLAMIGLAVTARVTAGFTGWRSALLTPAMAAGLAGIATAPLIAATFGTLSLMTVPANVIAAPIVPLATFAGMFVVAASWASPLAVPLGWLAWTFSYGLLWVSQLFAATPGGHLTFAPVEPATVFTIYFGLAFLLAPCVPEGRALVRRLDGWFRAAPAAAMLASLVAIGVIAIGVMAV